jgi:uncharacterized repeat protein (TIGR04138 family)
MKVELEGMGEFIPTPEDEAMLVWLSEQQPGFTPKEFLVALYVCRCVQLAKHSVSHARNGTHVSGGALLSVAEPAALSVFGPSARDWIRALDLGCSARFGKAVHWLVRRGLLCLSEGDRMSDFNVHSDYDSFLEERA